VTLSTVGLARIDCSDMREKPSSNPPHPAKRKSMATKDSISLVGILAVLVRWESGLVDRERESVCVCKVGILNQGGWLGVQRRRPAYSFSRELQRCMRKRKLLDRG